MAWTPGKAWTTGEVLTVWKAQTHWSDAMRSARNLWDHACHVSAASTPPFDIAGSNIYSPIPWRQVDWQIGTGVFSTANPTKFLAPVAGWYELVPTLVWDFSSGGTRTLGYRLNDASPHYDQHALQTNNNSFQLVNNAADIVQMTTADFLEVLAKQNSAEDGVKIVMDSNANNTRCSWRLIGAAS